MVPLSEEVIPECIWWEKIYQKVSFEFRVKEWTSDGWRKWRTERWVEINIKRWNWFMKWSRKFVSEVTWGILKRAISDFQRRGGWTYECDNRIGKSISSSLKREEIVDWWWELCKINQFILYVFVSF